MTAVGLTPTPVLELGGVDVAAGPAGDGTLPGLMVIDGAAVKWGRAEVLGPPTPATATVSLFDPSGEWAAATDPIGRTVTLRWTHGAESHVYFRGRIAAVTVTPRTARAPGGGTVRGATVALTCTSLLTDLGNRRPPSGAWPAETLAARRSRVAGHATGPVASIGTRAAWDTAPLAAVDTPDAASVLDALRDLLANPGADRWTWDPDTRAIDWIGRRAFAPDQVAHLARDSSRPGVYVTGPAVQRTVADPVTPAVTIPAGVVDSRGTVSRSLESRLTRTVLTWSDPLNGGAATETVVTTPGVDEAAVGVRAADVKTQLAGSSPALTAAQDVAAVVAGELSGWRLEPLRWDTTRTDGFGTLEQVRLLLAGTERTGVFWLAGSPLPTLGVLPLFGVLGGTITYKGGGWVVEWTTAPTAATGPYLPGVSWEDLDPSLVWSDDPDDPGGFDRSVTYEDLRFVPAGTITIGA